MPRRNDKAVFGSRLRLEVLVTVADVGSLDGADRLLGIGRSNLSHVIERIEELAGTALFERHPDGVSLTPAGGAAAQHARLLLRVMDAAESSFVREREVLSEP